MYEARRAAGPKADAAAVDAADAFVSAPRRAARSRASVLTRRVAPAALSVVLLGASGAVALNLKGQEATLATPAAVRDTDQPSRDAERPEALPTEQAEAPAEQAEQPEQAAVEEPAEETQSTDELSVSGAAAGEAADAAEEQTAPAAEGDAAFVGAKWAEAFGTSAGTKYAQAALNVRSQADSGSAELGQVKKGDKLSVTDKVSGDYRQIAYNGKIGYVLNAQLADQPPVEKVTVPSKSGGNPGTPGKPGEKVASLPQPGKSVLGLNPRAMVIYNAVTARWSFKSIGGVRRDSMPFHPSGRAIDFMTYNDSAKGWAVANFLAANASEFNIDHIIFEQKIWTTFRPYWRGMSDRGSVTANHYDHVHVAVK